MQLFAQSELVLSIARSILALKLLIMNFFASPVRLMLLISLLVSVIVLHIQDDRWQWEVSRRCCEGAIISNIITSDYG